MHPARSIYRYASVLLRAEKSLESESRTQQNLARQADAAHTELAALRVKCHAAQQEVLRLRTLIRHYEIRYPRAFVHSAIAPTPADGETDENAPTTADAHTHTPDVAAPDAAPSATAAASGGGGASGGVSGAPAGVGVSTVGVSTVALAEIAPPPPRSRLWALC